MKPLNQLFPTLRVYQSGLIEIVIANYKVSLLQEELKSHTILFKDGINLQLPNKLNTQDRAEAIGYFISVVEAVMQKVEYDNKPQPDEVKVERMQKNKYQSINYAAYKETIISNDSVIINWNK